MANTLGIIFTALICLGFILGLIWVIVDYCLENKKLNNILFIVFTILTILITIFTLEVNHNDYHKTIEAFQQSKISIEQSINNKKLSGLERLSLVEKSIKLNSKIVELKYDQSQWYGFDIPKEIQDVELINMEEE